MTHFTAAVRGDIDYDGLTVLSRGSWVMAGRVDRSVCVSIGGRDGGGVVGGGLKVNNRWHVLFTLIKQQDLFDRQ